MTRKKNVISPSFTQWRRSAEIPPPPIRIESFVVHNDWYEPDLLHIITPERRLTAEQVCERLTGMCLLALATATRDGRPIVGPVDGIFFRGAFHFGSSPDSVRFRHIRKRPHVSATHLPGEE